MPKSSSWNEQDVDSRGGDGLACVQAVVDVVQRVLESAGGSFLQVLINLELLRGLHTWHTCNAAVTQYPSQMQCMVTGSTHTHALPVMQARCDEKGFLAVAAFGLRVVHDDSPARGLAAALAIVEGLQVRADCMHPARQRRATTSTLSST